MTLQTKKRRATLTFLGAMGFYVVALLLATWLQGSVLSEGAGHTLVALLPVAAVLLLVWASLRLFLCGDELERRAAGIAAVAILTVFSAGTLCWGILEAMAGLPAINPVWWGAFSLAGWSATYTLVWKRYQ
ncbi:hypothetical protein [Natronospira bacteriovora]|uniref:Transmembrane protein n=1 Tax=Natronospira bacteriovora TaxID=3069753 RepID=A0ABU0W5E1_9GAMM|nr:hypothetical protein [Natronospira sp. AB-CW4]MDQ2068983.1 hypothetical protein [Natronospira sp. AB-CW4]